MSTATATLPPLADLVARVDLAELVAHWAGPSRIEGGRHWFHCPNPEHADRHPSFEVYRHPDGVERGRCWARKECPRGDALDLVGALERLDRGDAARWLRRWLGDPEHWAAPAVTVWRDRAPRDTPPAPREAPPVAPLPDTRYPAPEVAAAVLTQHLEGRGWPAEAADRFRLEVVLDNTGRPRVRYPFLAPTREGLEVYTWQDRATSDHGPRWRAPSGRPLPLFNLAALEAPELAAVVICEGPADAISAALALADHPHVGAVGVAGTQGWRPQWRRYFAGLEVIVATDGDTAGREAAAKITANLEGVAARVVQAVPAEGDLTDLARTAGLEALAAHLLGALGPVAAPPVTPPMAPPAEEVTPAPRAPYDAPPPAAATAALDLFRAGSTADPGELTECDIARLVGTYADPDPVPDDDAPEAPARVSHRPVKRPRLTLEEYLAAHPEVGYATPAEVVAERARRYTPPASSWPDWFTADHRDAAQKAQATADAEWLARPLRDHNTAPERLTPAEVIEWTMQ